MMARLFMLIAFLLNGTLKYILTTDIKKLTSLEKFSKKGLKDCDENQQLNHCLPRELPNEDFSNFPIQPSDFQEIIYDLWAMEFEKILSKYLKMLPTTLPVKIYDMFRRSAKGDKVRFTCSGCKALFFDKEVRVEAVFFFMRPQSKLRIKIMNQRISINLPNLYTEMGLTTPLYTLNSGTWINSTTNFPTDIDVSGVQFRMFGKDMASLTFRMADSPQQRIYCTTMKASSPDHSYACAYLERLKLEDLKKSMNNAMPESNIKPSNLEEKLCFLKEKDDEEIMFQYANKDFEKLDYGIVSKVDKNFFMGKTRNEAELIDVKDSIKGGSDFVTIRYKSTQSSMDRYLTFNPDDVVLSKCKFFSDKVEVDFTPTAKITTSQLQDLFQFDSNAGFGPTGSIYQVLSITLNNAGKLCLHSKLANGESILNGKISITNTTFVLCKDEIGTPTVECSYNDEIAFGSIAETCLSHRCNDGSSANTCPFVIRGELETYDFDSLRLIDESNSLSGSHEIANSRLLKFPINNVFFEIEDASHKYARIEGEAIFHGEKFRMQVVYNIFGGDEKMALCLDYMKTSTDKDTKITTDHGPISVLKLARLLAAPTTNIDTVTTLSFDNLKISFEKQRFYRNDNSGIELDKTLWCRDLSINNEEQWKDIVPILDDDDASRRNADLWSNGRDKPEVIIEASALNLECEKACDDYKHVCKFFEQRLQTTHNSYYGYFDGERLEMRLKAAATKNFKLFEGLSLHSSDNAGLTHTFGVVLVTESRDELPTSEGTQQLQAYDRIMGTLESNVYAFLNGQIATITFNEGKAYFQIMFGSPVTPEPNFMGAPNVDVRAVDSYPQVIDLENMNSIELSCHIQVGPNNHEILFGSQDNSNSNQDKSKTRQFLYSNSRLNKFWICKEDDESLSNLLQSACIDTKNFFLQFAKVKPLCLVYTQDDTWCIDEKKIMAKKGLSYHGITRIRTVIGGEKKELPLDFELHITNKKLTMELPPIIQDEYFAILRSNDLPNAGPILEIDFYSDNLNWELIGITKIFQMTLKQKLVLNGDFSFESKDDGLIPESDVDAFNKGFKVNGKLNYNNMENTLNLEWIKVVFDGKLLVSKVQDEYTKARQAAFADANLKLNRLDNYLQVIEQKLTSHKVDTSSKSTRSSILSNISKIEDSFNRYEDELWKECNQICRMTMVPGYKWDNCHLARNISCLKFKKNALMSANMHCLADCEIKQAEAYEKSNESGDLHQKLKTRAISLNSPDEIHNELALETKRKVDAFKSRLSDVRTNKQQMEQIHEDSRVIGFQAPIFNSGFTKRDSNKFPIEDLLVRIFAPSKSEIFDVFLFDENIASTIALWRFKVFSKEKINPFLQSVKDAEFRNDEIMQTITNWERKYRVQLERRCREKAVVKTKAEGNFFDRMKLSDRLSAVFKVDQPDTAAAIAQSAPWYTLMKNDPLDTNNYKGNNDVNFVKRDYHITSANDCTSATGKLSMYEDMSAYMKSWIEAYDAGNQTLREYQRDISQGLKRFSHDMTAKRSSQSRSPTVEKVQKMWYERLSTGFQTWSIELKRQVEELQSKGASKMISEMNNIFTPKGETTLMSYFQSSNAINKRADDMTLLEQTDQIFGNGLKNMKTLNDGRELLQQIDQLIDQAKQSNIRCHDEL